MLEAAAAAAAASSKVVSVAVTASQTVLVAAAIAVAAAVVAAAAVLPMKANAFLVTPSSLQNHIPFTQQYPVEARRMPGGRRF